MQDSTDQVRRTAVNHLRSLQTRFDSAAQRWPELKHRISAFERWPDCKEHLGTDTGKGRSLLKSDLRESQWCSGEDPCSSQFWLLNADDVWVMGEFSVSDTEPAPEPISLGISSFCSLAEQAFNVLKRSIDILDVTVADPLRAALETDRSTLPAHPWLVFVYGIATKYYSPGSMADIVYGCVKPARLIVTENGKEADLGDSLDKVAPDKHLQEYRKLRRGKTRVGFELRSAELAPKIFSNESNDALLQGIAPNGRIALKHDVFSSSWTTLDLVCQWLEGSAVPITLGEHSDVRQEQQTSRRPCRQRDLLWKKWREEEKLTDAVIRDKWNGMREEQRKDVSPDCCDKLPAGKVGSGRVKSALKRLA